MDKQTSIEQGELLLSVGVERNTHDLCYLASICDANGIVFDEPRFHLSSRFVNGRDIYGIPCWSLGRLLDLLPITIDGDRADGYSLTMWKSPGEHSWTIEYFSEEKGRKAQFSGQYVDAVVSMIQWLRENRYELINNN